MIEIACAADEAFAPHCATMLHSLLAHHPRGAVRVHLLHSALSQDALGRMARMVGEAGAVLNPVAVPDREVADLPALRFHVACWYRILLPALLPQVSRVLYVDSDTLVLGDLRDLWDTDLQGRLFGAVVNPLYPFMPEHWRALGLERAAEYLNSGVMLLDLARLRAAGTITQLRRHAREHPQNPYPEQDALSVVCRGQWLELHPRWNAQTTLYDLPPAQLPFARADAEQARAHPAIVHFIGPLKPWHYLCRHPLRQLYARHRRQTPWPEFDLEGRTLGNALLRPFSLGVQLKLRSAARRLSSLVTAR